MTQELSKSLKCILMRSGVRIWMEEAKTNKLQDVLDSITQHKFIRFEGQSFNTADLEGVYYASSMEDLTRHKNGQWQCQKGTWHEKRQDCDCVSKYYEDLPIFDDVSEEERARTVKVLEEIKKKMFDKSI